MRAGEHSKLRRIIVFDSWTGGTVNLIPLVDAFAERHIEMLLIHIGSWGHEPAGSAEETIGSIKSRDISYYEGHSFEQILLDERPAAVLFLSTQAFAHRAFNRYARSLGIPTLHLYHGVVGVQPVGRRRSSPLSLRGHAALVRDRIGKNALRLWPVYARALWNTHGSIRDWLRFGYDVARRLLGLYGGVAAPDATTTVCCVYTDADREHARMTYHMPRDRIFAVGNPDLARFGVTKKHLGIATKSSHLESKDVVYIATGLLDSGAAFSGAADFVRHLSDTHQELERHGLRLVVKLHPAYAKTAVPSAIESKGFELCSNEEFITRLAKSCAAIVEPSSASVMPALLGLPVLMAQYGKLSAQAYGEVLTSYPRVASLTSLEHLADLLRSLAHVPEKAIRDWIEENAGPLPADLMPKRVANALCEVIESAWSGLDESDEDTNLNSISDPTESDLA